MAKRRKRMSKATRAKISRALKGNRNAKGRHKKRRRR